MNKDEQELIELENKVLAAEDQGLPIDEFVLKEIEILQRTIDQFIIEMKQNGRYNDISVAEIEIGQYAAMKKLAQKINYPFDIYDEKIKLVQCRIFGEENWETFFADKNK